MIRILVVGESFLICNIISSLLEKHTDMEIVGCAVTNEEAVHRVKECDVVLLDSRLSDQHKFPLIRLLSKAGPRVKVIVLGLDHSERVILHHLEAGAAGYVLQDETVEQLLRTIRTTFQGESLISPRMTALLIARLGELKQLLVKQGLQSAILPPLTEREREILSLVKQGLGNREISERLVIEVGTVKNHVHNILRKFNVSSRRDIPSLLETLNLNQITVEHLHHNGLVLDPGGK